MPEQLTINWTVTPEQAELVLGSLAKQKLSRVIDVFIALRQQAGQQIQQHQQAQQQPQPGAVPMPNGHAGTELRA